MAKICNNFCVTMRDGTKREIEAGRIEVGKSGELLIKEVDWSFWNTFESVRETIAPGLWAEWAKYAVGYPKP